VIIPLPKNTVKTRTFYARKRLAQLLSTHRDFDHLMAARAAPRRLLCFACKYVGSLLAKALGFNSR
jgi:hypothetical protein